MGFFEFFGIFIFIYYLINLILWVILDSNIELAFKDHFGQPISSLRGKVVWITGASSGIGKYLAISLAKCGVKLVLSSRREDELCKVKKECLENCNGLITDDDILILPMDMLDIENHQNYFNQVTSYFNHFDILVNNAGRSQRAKWDEIELQVDRELFELDVFSIVNLSRIAVRYFKEVCGGKGHLAITSSGAGLIPVPNSASYCGAKHALNGYYAALKVEEPSIDVTIFCPGPIRTNFLEQSFTGKEKEKFGVSVGETDKRMTAERCGHLFAVALANKLMLSWVGLFPISMLLYISLYFPNLRIIILKILGKQGMAKIREGK